MILLDTHVWVWWVHGDTNLPSIFAAEMICTKRTGSESVRFRAGKSRNWSLGEARLVGAVCG